MDASLTFSLGRLARLPLGLGLLVMLSPLGCGPGAKGECLPLGNCGGNPMGSWKVVDPAASVCQVPVVRPTQATADVIDFGGHTMPLSPTIAPPQPNPVVLQQTTSGDWCSSLVLTPAGAVENANLWHDSPVLDSGTVNFASDHTYLTLLNFSTKSLSSDRNTTHFAPRCLLANGGGHPDPTTGLPAAGICTVLTDGLKAYYLAGQVSAAVPITYTDIACTSAPDGGCDCTSVFNLEIDDSGTWKVPADDPTSLLQDSTLLTYNAVMVNSQSAAATIKSTFCASPNQLQLTGPNGGGLFTLQGLRWMALSPAM